MKEFKTLPIIDTSKKLKVPASLTNFDSAETSDMLEVSMPEEIKVEDIRNKVMSEISSAQKEILATMDISEELSNPLPEEYFILLKKKSQGGVEIKRIVFGSKEQYDIFVQKMNDRKLFFMGDYTKSKNYRRMILIDGVKLFFKKESEFYFTTDQKYIEEYKKYFDSL